MFAVNFCHHRCISPFSPSIDQSTVVTPFSATNILCHISPSPSDKRGGGGQRIIRGSILLHLAASAPAGYNKLTAGIRLAYSYLITPHTLEMHTAGVLGAVERDERDDAVGDMITEWLASAGQQGRHSVPEGLVHQVGLRPIAHEHSRLYGNMQEFYLVSFRLTWGLINDD